MATIAGGVAVGLYLVERKRAGDLDWTRDIWRVLALAVGLIGLVGLLLAPDPVPSVAISTLALLAGIYLIRTAQPRTNLKMAGWVFIAIGVGGIASLVFRLGFESVRGITS